MRIAILTQPLRNNYGGILQNFALQRTLNILGHEAITIDQGGKDVSHIRQWLFDIKKSLLHLVDPRNNAKPIYRLNEDQEKVVRANTLYFINKYIKHTNVCKSEAEILEAATQYNPNAYIVGSDQCWRASFNPHFPSMFFNFLKDRDDVIRIAYAASFGTNQWELKDKETGLYRELVTKFDLVTVREFSGIDICKNVLGVSASHVLDPTLLLCKGDYLDLISNEGERISDGNLFTYILDPSKEKDAFIENIAQQQNLISFTVLPKFKEEYCTAKDINNHIEDCVYPPVSKWLRAFMDAKMVIVDSFHGAVFSIIFNKPFWVIANPFRGNTRFDSLLSTFGLDDRLVTPSQLTSIDYNKPINWDSVNKILSEKRKISLNLLTRALDQ